MMLCGGLRSRLSDCPVVKMSLFVTRLTLFQLPVWSTRDKELTVSKFGGKPRGITYGGVLFTKIFGQYVCCEVFLIL